MVMIFKHIIYNWTYNGNEYSANPFEEVKDPDDTNFGTPLYQVLGMTEAQAQQIATDHKWEEIRRVRNIKIAETDWWANSDLTMTTEQTAYRQALRDITTTYSSPDDVVWPTKP